LPKVIWIRPHCARPTHRCHTISRLTVFARWRQQSNVGLLFLWFIPHLSCQMAARSVQPFLHSQCHSLPVRLSNLLRVRRQCYSPCQTAADNSVLYAWASSAPALHLPTGQYNPHSTTPTSSPTPRHAYILARIVTKISVSVSWNADLSLSLSRSSDICGTCRPNVQIWLAALILTLY